MLRLLGEPQLRGSYQEYILVDAGLRCVFHCGPADSHLQSGLGSTLVLLLRCVQNVYQADYWLSVARWPQDDIAMHEKGQQPLGQQGLQRIGGPPHGQSGAHLAILQFPLVATLRHVPFKMGTQDLPPQVSLF